jgi:hypothetical protein
MFASMIPNRTDPKRFVRLVLYRRTGDQVTPYLAQEHADGAITVGRLEWPDIKASDPDPDFETAWMEHVRNV